VHGLKIKTRIKILGRRSRRHRQSNQQLRIMIKINYYTGKYQSAIPQSKINIRSHALIHESPDAREYDDFGRTLRSQGLELGDFIKYFPRKKMNQFALVRLATA